MTVLKTLGTVITPVLLLLIWLGLQLIFYFYIDDFNDLFI